MKISDAARAVGCSCRAIKLYEEKGLMPGVARADNSYREYTQEDVRRLHEICAYRKLGISIGDIRRLLDGDKDSLLPEILERKRSELAARQEELAALEAFLRDRDAQALDEAIDFDSVASAMRAQMPGFFGECLVAHFAPYLNHRITSAEQREAYQTILSFWDAQRLRLPLSYYLSAALSKLAGQPSAGQTTAAMDARIAAMLHPDEETYARLKAQTLRTVKQRENPLVRYALPEVMKRRMMHRLQDCGYNDVFIPAMKRLSPAYRAYHDALDALNNRLCQDLGLYYDSDFNLRIRKP